LSALARVPFGKPSLVEITPAPKEMIAMALFRGPARRAAGYNRL